MMATSSAGQFMFKADLAPGSKRGEFTGTASSTNSDRRDQFFTEKALQSMQQQVPVKLCSWGSHFDALTQVECEIGAITSFSIREDAGGSYLDFEGSLDPSHPMYEFYCNKMTNDSVFRGEYKVSVAGYVGPNARRMVNIDGKRCESLDDISLDHVLLCRSDAAINQDSTFGGKAEASDWKLAIFKAASEAELGAPGERPADARPAPVERLTSKAELGGKSFAEITREIEFQLDKMRETAESPYPYVLGVWDSYVIYCDGDDDYRCTWVVDGDGAVTLGEPVEITRGWVDADDDVVKAEAHVTEKSMSAVSPTLRSTDRNQLKRPLPDSLEGKAEGGSTMPDEKKSGLLGRVAEALASLQEFIMCSDGGAADAAEVEVVATAETPVVGVTVEPAESLETVVQKAVGTAVDVRLEAISAKIVELVDSIKVLVPEDEVPAVEDTAEAALAEAEVTVVEDTAAEVAAVAPDAAVAAASEEVPVVAELTGMSQEDVVALHRNLQSLWETQGTMVERMEQIGETLNSLAARVELVGKAEAPGSQQLPRLQTTLQDQAGASGRLTFGLSEAISGAGR